MDAVWTPLEVLNWTTERFAREGLESPRLEAQVLLAHVLGCDRIGLYTQFDKPLGNPELSSYRGLIRRRLAGEPVAYLVGEQEFWSIALTVGPEVLIPRRDSETVVETVLDRIEDRHAELCVLDVATGSGALALALARELPRARVVGTDISEAAVAVAAENARRNELAERTRFVTGDGLEPVVGEGSFDILVANLPYVPSAELKTLAPEVRREPSLALDGGEDGLDLLRTLIPRIPEVLAPGGLAALEHAWNQAKAVRDLFEECAAFEAATTRPDLAGNDRVTSARRRG